MVVLMRTFIICFMACLLANFVYDFVTAQAILSDRKNEWKGKDPE